jgi:hypothetical protein
MVRQAYKGRFRGRTVTPQDVEAVYHKYGEAFALRLEEFFGKPLFRNSRFPGISEEEASRMRAHMLDSASCREILRGIAEEAGHALRDMGISRGSSLYSNKEAIAKIILYAQRSAIRATFPSGAIDSAWKQAFSGIRTVMRGRLKELRKEKEGLDRRQVPSTAVDEKIARYEELLNSNPKYTRHLREAFAKSGSLREFFESVFHFDPHHIGFLNKGKARQMMIGFGDNALDLGINRLLSTNPAFGYSVGEASLRMKFVPDALLYYLPSGKREFREALAREAVEGIAERAGGVENVPKASERARASVAGAVLPAAAEAGGKKPTFGSSLKEAGAKTTLEFSEKEVLEGMASRARKSKGVAKIAVLAVAALSTYILLEGMQKQSAVSRAVPWKVK